MMDMHAALLATSGIDAEGHRALTALFDRLWSSRPSAQSEQTMRALLALIEQYEAALDDDKRPDYDT